MRNSILPSAGEPPLVSVALCTYNGARFLREQLDSLLSQDYPNFEIVAVDDGSMDGTIEVLHSYAQQDRRLQVSRNEHNLGFLKNFERALGLCRGTYLAPCDQDDIWDRRKLGVLMARREGAGLVYCDSEFIDQNSRRLNLKISDKFNMYAGSDPRVFTFHNCISGHALICSREIIMQAMPFPPSFFHDWWLAYVAAATDRIAYVDECLVKYRQHASSYTDLAGRRPAQVRPRGFRRKHWLQQGEWLTLLKDYPSNPYQPFFQELHHFWMQWQDAYIAPGLSRFLSEHRDVLFTLLKKKDTWPIPRAWKMFWGLKTRAITQPYRYGAPDDDLLPLSGA